MDDKLLTLKIRGYCNYCKDEILLGEDYIVSEENKYYISCYKLVKERDGNDYEKT